MDENGETWTGGCLCGQVRYHAVGEPMFAGLCFCADCRKASGSGFVPYMGFAASQMRMSGETQRYACTAANGGEAVRNSCPACGGLVFGGIWGEDVMHTVYAGSLDDPSRFRPTAAIFTRDKPDWAVIPEGLAVFAAMPTG
jgi:hypothetical protein